MSDHPIVKVQFTCDAYLHVDVKNEFKQQDEFKTFPEFQAEIYKLGLEAYLEEKGNEKNNG